MVKLRWICHSNCCSVSERASGCGIKKIVIVMFRLYALRGAVVLLQELVLNIENCCAIIARPLCCSVCKCKASFQRRQFRVTIDLGAAISIYSDASFFPGVPYLKSVAPIDLTGVTGDSMRCKGSIPAPLTLSIDGFTNCKSDAYGTFTVQSGFKGSRRYMWSQYMLDPNLFISALTPTDGQKHGTDFRLR